jgi:hypothetical protein
MIRHHRHPLAQPESDVTTKRGWRVSEWANDVGLSRAKTFLLVADQTIKSVKVGTARIIVTSPADFLASRADKAEAAE